MDTPYLHTDENSQDVFHYPIIFLRGFAMRREEIEETVNDPFSGFEKGSTKFRQGVGGDVEPYYFESPVLRLIADHGYEDAYHEGREPQTADELDKLRRPERTLWVYRYYEQASKDFGDGKRDEIESIANGLDDMIERLRKLYTGLDEIRGPGYGAHFKVRIVAHSMGGLVVRSYLQKVFPARHKARTGTTYAKKNSVVDKVFTYGTPHNGIEVRVLGNHINIGLFDISNFHRSKIAGYLGLPANSTAVNSLKGKFPPERFFCLIGTNERDYNVPASRAAVGPLSDGLVRIDNAWVEGSPRAHINRAHGGPFGMVNSEDGYQNLVRFLFGDTRVDGSLELDEITLPQKIQDAKEEGKEVRANFYFDNVVSVRGAFGWSLSRRKMEENSSVRREFGALFSQNDFKKQKLFLFSSFLDRRRIVLDNGEYMAFAIDLAFLVDRFVVERKWWPDASFDGASFFQDRLIVEVAPQDGSGPWKLRYRFNSSTSVGSYSYAEAEMGGQGVSTFRIPIVNDTRPGVRATIVLTASEWS